MSIDTFGTAKKTWRTLESNPDVLTNLIHLLGAPSSYQVDEIFGTSPDLLEFVPKPVKGVIFLSPLTPNCLTFREAELQSSPPLPSETESEVFFMKQLVGNACGTVALTHILLNIPDVIQNMSPGSFFKRYYTTFPPQTNSKENPIEFERGKYFAADEEVEKLHDNAAVTTSHVPITPQTTKEEEQLDMYDTILHYVAFVPSTDNKYILELDGGRTRPIVHINPNPEDITGTSLLYKSVEIAQQIMSLDPDEIQFTLLAVTKNE